jgi:predicted nucleic acid-binding protein
MENEIICLDTSVLIDYFRKKIKEKTFFYELTKNNTLFAVSVVTEYEIYFGSNNEQDIFWNEFFKNLTVLPFNSDANKLSIEIARNLKKKNKMIDIPDLFIGGTALSNNLKLATLNSKHFENIDKLELITKNDILKA